MYRYLLFSQVLTGSVGSCRAGWACKRMDYTAETPHITKGVVLRGRRMLTDRHAVPEYVHYGDSRQFPATYECQQQETLGVPIADVLRPVFSFSDGARAKAGDCTSDGATCVCPGNAGASGEGLRSVFDTDGAILLRGLPLTNASDLSTILQELNVTNMPYTGGVAPRSEVSKGVMQASVEPPSVTIEPHWEMSYAAEYPQILLFFCKQRPATLGEGLTPITNGRSVLRKLRELGIAQLFENRDVLYRFYYPSKNDKATEFATFVWQVAFGTDNKTEVDEFLQRRQLEYPSLQWNWTQTTAGGPEALEYTFRSAALAAHPSKPGEQVWFNQITSMHRSYFHSHASFPSLLNVPVPFGLDASKGNAQRYPFDTSFGDGEEIPEETIRTIRQVYWNNTVVFQWEPGDLLVLDNMVAAHGRMDYDAGKLDRELFVSLIRVS